jgi:hypothetical protein
MAEERHKSAPARDDRDEAERRRSTRKEQDVLLDVSELEVEKITLEVAGLRAHVSVLAQLASLVNLQVGVDARLNRVKLEIEGVRAKVLLKVWLDDVRAILEKALDTLGEHPEILESLVKAINELLQGRLGDAWRVWIRSCSTHSSTGVKTPRLIWHSSVRARRWLVAARSL